MKVLLLVSCLLFTVISVSAEDNCNAIAAQVASKAMKEDASIKSYQLNTCYEIQGFYILGIKYEIASEGQEAVTRYCNGIMAFVRPVIKGPPSVKVVTKGVCNDS